MEVVFSLNIVQTTYHLIFTKKEVNQCKSLNLIN